MLWNIVEYEKYSFNIMEILENIIEMFSET